MIYFLLSDSVPSHKGILTKTGVGKFTLMCKNKSGIQEEWKVCFSKWGVIMVVFEIIDRLDIYHGRL